MQVIAIAKGYDGITVRQPGEEFTMPDEVFEKRPKLFPAGHINEGKPTGQFYDPPSWFRKKSDAREKAVSARAAALDARNKADGAPGDKNLAKLADQAETKASDLEKRADKADEGEGELA